MVQDLQPDFDARLTLQGDSAWLTLVGELDVATVDLAFAQLDAAAAAKRLTIDLRGLQFMDATGLRLLVHASRRFAAPERALRIVRGPRCVQRVISVASLDERFEFIDGCGRRSRPVAC